MEPVEQFDIGAAVFSAALAAAHALIATASKAPRHICMQIAHRPRTETWFCVTYGAEAGRTCCRGTGMR